MLSNSYQISKLTFLSRSSVEWHYSRFTSNCLCKKEMPEVLKIQNPILANLVFCYFSANICGNPGLFFGEVAWAITFTQLKLKQWILLREFEAGSSLLLGFVWPRAWQKGRPNGNSRGRVQNCISSKSKTNVILKVLMKSLGGFSFLLINSRRRDFFVG